MTHFVWEVENKLDPGVPYYMTHPRRTGQMYVTTSVLSKYLMEARIFTTKAAATSAGKLQGFKEGGKTTEVVVITKEDFERWNNASS